MYCYYFGNWDLFCLYGTSACSGSLDMHTNPNCRSSQNSLVGQHQWHENLQGCNCVKKNITKHKKWLMKWCKEATLWELNTFMEYFVLCFGPYDGPIKIKPKMKPYLYYRTYMPNDFGEKQNHCTANTLIRPHFSSKVLIMRDLEAVE